MENNKIFIKPVSIEGTMMIYQQMTNCICKVKNNQKIGTGFFCKIPYQNNNKINVLITSYQILNEDYLKYNNQITLLLGDYNQQKIIFLNPGRNIYYNKEYNTTIIELNANDYINNFIELDDNLFRNDLKTLYKNESIYTLHYLNGGKAFASFGILNQLNNYNIEHSCEIQSGGDGAPILNLINNKLIGISLETKDNLNYNKGIILKYPIEDFINRYIIQVQQNFMIMNNNFQNMGMYNNFQMPNIMMNNNNFIANNNGDEEWLKGFMLGVRDFQNEEEGARQGPKINVIFSTTKGRTDNLCFKYGTTIDEILKIYLKRVNREELIGRYDKICFLVNAQQIKFGDKTPVEKLFKLNRNPKVVVNDVYNLIPVPKKITFKSTIGNTRVILTYDFVPVENIISEYLEEINKFELLKSDKLGFLYNGKKINSEDMKIAVGVFFKNDNEPKILVYDPNNLIK